MTARMIAKGIAAPPEKTKQYQSSPPDVLKYTRRLCPRVGNNRKKIGYPLQAQAQEAGSSPSTPFTRLAAGLGGPCHVRDQSGEQAAAVGAAHRRFDVIFGMRHHAEHIAACVEDAGDRIDRAVDVPCGIERAVG